MTDQLIQEEQGWVVITLPERFDEARLKTYEQHFSKYLSSQDPVKILFDFSQVLYIDSTGIGALIRLYGTVQSRKGRLAMTGCRENIVKIFKLVNLQRYIKIFPTRQEAYQSAA